MNNLILYVSDIIWGRRLDENRLPTYIEICPLFYDIDDCIAYLEEKHGCHILSYKYGVV